MKRQEIIAEAVTVLKSFGWRSATQENIYDDKSSRTMFKSMLNSGIAQSLEEESRNNMITMLNEITGREVIEWTLAELSK